MIQTKDSSRFYVLHASSILGDSLWGRAGHQEFTGHGRWDVGWWE